MLYTTPENPAVTLKEIKIPDDSYYALITYVSKDIVKVNSIGQEYDYEIMGINSEFPKGRV